MHAVAQKVNVQHKPKSPPVSDAKCVVLVFFFASPRLSVPICSAFSRAEVGLAYQRPL